MPTGSKWKVYIPSELAYGANPRPGGVIKPHMALIFEIELISVDIQ
jgi:FKBP-type peptidyl-prolyl cis-trans isomerase FklB